MLGHTHSPGKSDAFRTAAGACVTFVTPIQPAPRPGATPTGADGAVDRLHGCLVGHRPGGDGTECDDQTNPVHHYIQRQDCDSEVLVV
ncbi:MAG: hypothetical protein ABEH86_10210 [Haloarcula sp.]